MGSNSKSVVARQRKKLLIQREPSQVFQRVTIGSLPDNVLLDIFDFYQVFFKRDFVTKHSWNWEKLVHVCRRWRYIIFESPIRLNLRLFCTKKSPVRKLLDVWPPFPLVIRLDYSYSYWAWEDPKDCINFTNNLVAAFERRDRVHEIQADISNAPNDLSDQIFAALEVPFPALRSFSFQSSEENIFLPGTLLNGSAPCLRDLTLSGISFPSLPRLLSSTSDLRSLNLYNIPEYGYISPEIMAISLSALPKLECLMITFKDTTPHRPHGPHPEWRNRASTRFVLPALTRLCFHGVSEYLETLVVRFDAPLLDDFRIAFFNQRVFDIPQTARFFSCYLDSFNASSLTLIFNWQYAAFTFPSKSTHHSVYFPCHGWNILCEDMIHQVFCLAQICGQITPFRSGVKSLIIKSDCLNDIDDPTLWLQLFHSFPSLQSLQIPVMLEPSIASALERPTEGSPAAAEVFPSLHSLSIVGKTLGKAVQEHIQSFVAIRQRSGRPVAVSRIKKHNHHN
ncbi:hypothetical protein BGW80DRAFT_1563388 [Lactifluus volemus]|nr:hypothetical protein BGW80DRAFT_1563388 [Lactifluus volemus]